MAGSRERYRAKALIYALIRESGGSFAGLTRLYKAFYFAHLDFAKNNPGLLSVWPIVRMPRGPGIDSGDRLVAELEDEGYIRSAIIEVPYPYRTKEYSTTEKAFDSVLGEAELVSIRNAIQLVKDKTATQLSEETHEYSVSWNDAANGQELAIYTDLLADEERNAMRQKSRDIAEHLRTLEGL